MSIFVCGCRNYFDEDAEARSSTIHLRCARQLRKLRIQRRDFTRYSASEAEELENLDGVGVLLS